MPTFGRVGRDHVSIDALGRSMVIDAPVQDVWRAISQAEHLAGWFCDAAVLELRPGSSGALTFDRRATHAAVTVPIVVQRVIPPYALAFRWLQPDGVAPVRGNSLEVLFDLAAEGDDRTRVMVTESGLLHMDWSDSDRTAYVEEHGAAWDVHLANLREYVHVQRDFTREEDL